MAETHPKATVGGAASARGLLVTGAALADQGRLEEAAVSFRSALRLNPKDGQALVGLGKVLIRQGKPREAAACFQRALAIEPKNPLFHTSLGSLLLLQGKFREGWREFDWIWQVEAVRRDAPDLGKPEWDGSLLGERTCLVRCPFGFGDNLQWARFAAVLAARGGRVVLQCQPELVGLLRTLARVKVISLEEPLPPFDVHVPLLRLPHLLGLSGPKPDEVPYVRASAANVERWAQRLAPYSGLRVGLVWACDPTHPTAEWRSASFADLQPLMEVPGVTLFSLQKGPAADQIEAASGTPRIEDLGAELTDFADTAALLTQLDITISVDTAAAHLAGALGLPVWVMVCAFPDARWLLGRNDSPWYPSARLFRQGRPGDLSRVVARLASELSKMAARK